MGLFDLFKGSQKADGKPRPKASPAAKWADRVERRVQNYDRQEAIQALSEMETAEAVEVLLKRFTFHMDPSITDQEEKDAAFRGILRAGRAAIEPVRAFAAKAESLAWPMKIIKALVDEAEYIEELLRWLSKWDTEYAKFVDPKVQILAALEEHRHPQHPRRGRALPGGRQRARPLSCRGDPPGPGGCIRGPRAREDAHRRGERPGPEQGGRGPRATSLAARGRRASGASQHAPRRIRPRRRRPRHEAIAARAGLGASRRRRAPLACLRVERSSSRDLSADCVVPHGELEGRPT